MGPSRRGAHEGGSRPSCWAIGPMRMGWWARVFGGCLLQYHATVPALQYPHMDKVEGRFTLQGGLSQGGLTPFLPLYKEGAPGGGMTENS
jgi:hypothetical protein